MPILYCSSDNHHEDSKLSFELKLLTRDLAEEWLSYELVFNIGKEERVFRSIDKVETTFTGVPGKVGQFAFSLKPKNELETLVSLIEKFLSNDEQKTMSFEPADPSFELNIERTHGDEFKVYIWIDAGNTKQLEYTWDAQGLRFFATKEKLESFVSELKVSS